MRFWEGATLALSVWLAYRAWSDSPGMLAGTVYIALAIHWIAEGPRWQMWPAYAAIAAASLALLAGPSTAAKATAAVAFLLTLASLAACVAVPVFRLPMPSGPFPVGTSVAHLKLNRADEGNPSRDLMVQFWYPAQRRSAECRQSPYRMEPARYLPWRLRHLTLVRTNACLDAEAAPGRHPLLIYSPSWTGQRGGNTMLHEALASNGYVVAAIDHPSGSSIVVLPDGRSIRTAMDAEEDYSSAEAVNRFLSLGEREVRIRAADSAALLDLLRLGGHSMAEHVDWSKAGIYGHSFGGAVAAEATRLDPRFKVCVNLDGLLFGEARRAGIAVPFLMVAEDVPPPSEQANQGRQLAVWKIHQDALTRTFRQHGGALLRIRGALHKNFSDSPLFSKVQRLNGAGDIGPERCAEILNAHILDFVNTALLAKDSANPRFPEAALQLFPAQASVNGVRGKVE